MSLYGILFGETTYYDKNGKVAKSYTKDTLFGKETVYEDKHGNKIATGYKVNGLFGEKEVIRDKNGKKVRY